ncbi:hypothetical protein OM076_18740 [Solirubrobacter ginsenosidimutans]|uniref:Uncharacterized protein n=1 Tax=Solirubrobacter ginsenosidimutans TaxID=490573 RepID=A0A9X3S3P7_9ACTN|nr:hypothetical protein [Solirubrobacter ginsenosidimutans]MDA0162316.1 hypothetical protein [Solirubrobacter ginsenosidimutans]
MAFGDGDQGVVMFGEASEAEVVEDLVDDVDDARVAGALEQPEVERAVEVEERARVPEARRRDALVDDGLQMRGVVRLEAPGEAGEHRDLEEGAQLERRVEVGRRVLDDPEPAVANLLDHAAAGELEQCLADRRDRHAHPGRERGGRVDRVRLDLAVDDRRADPSHGLPSQRGALDRRVEAHHAGRLARPCSRIALR